MENLIINVPFVESGSTLYASLDPFLVSRTEQIAKIEQGWIDTLLKGLFSELGSSGKIIVKPDEQNKVSQVFIPPYPQCFLSVCVVKGAKESVARYMFHLDAMEQAKSKKTLDKAVKLRMLLEE